MAAQTRKLSKVLVGGGTGFIGAALCQTLKKHGYNVTLISRTAGPSKITWKDLEKERQLPECDAVINLAGENILNPLKRWTPEFKAEVRSSRIETTQLLADLIQNAENPPNVWISSSAEGWYPTSLTEVFTEESPAPTQHTYLTKLCHDWEKSAMLPTTTPTRHVTIRIGVVLGRDGGAYQAMVWPFWFGLGGPVGSGKQIFPWIHISDTVGIFMHALENNHVTGVLNATAPNPVTNAEFTKVLASVLCRPAFIPVPETAVNIMFGNERASLLLKGKRVIPKRTMESGYEYLFPDIKSCLQDIAS